jgi:hypothetical protein
LGYKLEPTVSHFLFATNQPLSHSPFTRTLPRKKFPTRAATNTAAASTLGVEALVSTASAEPSGHGGPHRERLHAGRWVWLHSSRPLESATSAQVPISFKPRRPALYFASDQLQAYDWSIMLSLFSFDFFAIHAGFLSQREC